MQGGSAEVWNSKARSARLLHESTASDDLKLFLTYYSISAAYGNVVKRHTARLMRILTHDGEELCRPMWSECAVASNFRWGMAAATLAMSGNRDGGEVF